MDLGIAGKSALVVASSQGLGKAVALGLAAEGVKLVICSRNKKSIESTKEEIQKRTNSEVLAFQADVTNNGDIKKLVAKTFDHFGAIHILVNNAGGPPTGLFGELTDDKWQKAVELTLMSSVRLTREVLPIMKTQKWGRVINITSISVKQPINELLLSNSIRMSILGWAKTLSNQVAKDGILINNVCPGWTRTDRVVELIQSRAELQGNTPEEIATAITSDIPMGRMGRPEEFANLVVFLASERASYITGTSIQVDGGAVKGVY